MTDEQLRGLSSMATKELLAQLSELLRREHGADVRFSSAGGVEVEQQVRDGVRADLVVLAQGAIARLDAEGFLTEGTSRPMFVSDVVAAMPSSSNVPAFTTEDDLRSILLNADRIAYSTGPSGAALLHLIERWGMTGQLERRYVQAMPGVPVACLLADGRADIGFQQRSEFAGAAGVNVLGPLPGGAAIQSVFSGAVLKSGGGRVAAERALESLTGDGTEPIVRACGLMPA